MQSSTSISGYPQPLIPGLALSNPYLIPMQCFLFFPEDEFCFLGEPPHKKFNNKHYRRIFEGHHKFLPLEQTKL